MYSSSTHGLENIYTRKQGALICQGGTNFFKSNLKNIWEQSEERKEIEVWTGIKKVYEYWSEYDVCISTVEHACK